MLSVPRVAFYGRREEGRQLCSGMARGRVFAGNTDEGRKSKRVKSKEKERKKVGQYQKSTGGRTQRKRRWRM